MGAAEHIIGLNELLANAAAKGQDLSPCHGKMCADCAFRIQEDINGYSQACQSAMDLLLCNDTGARFHCHTKNYEDAGKPCAGFLYAKQYFDHIEKEIDEIDARDLSIDSETITENHETINAKPDTKPVIFATVTKKN